MVKNRKKVIGVILLLVICGVFAVVNGVRQANQSQPSVPDGGQIYLYGEAHGVEKILDKEFELWNNYYQTQGMRHLFVEYPYYTAAFLNEWMQSEDNLILDEIYADWQGTQAQVPQVKAFLEKIKAQCPETIFHGTDVGHQYGITGKRYLEHLKNNGLDDSKEYALALEAIEQGKQYYASSNQVYRENKMVENFIREIDELSGEAVMGIYGAAHISVDGMDYATQSIPCMANQLKKHYQEVLYTEDLSYLEKDIEPLRVDTITIGEKDYKASYFGRIVLTNKKTDYVSREFWRLENAYEDFKDRPKTQTVLPYRSYPMLIEEGQVFVVDGIKKDQSVTRVYFRSAGSSWKGLPATEQFTIE